MIYKKMKSGYLSGDMVVAMVSVSATLTAGLSLGFGMFLALRSVFTRWELVGVSGSKGGRRGAQRPPQRRSDLPVRSHLWRVMDFPLALLPRLSGEKAGPIR